VTAGFGGDLGAHQPTPRSRRHGAAATIAAPIAATGTAIGLGAGFAAVVVAVAAAAGAGAAAPRAAGLPPRCPAGAFVLDAAAVPLLPGGGAVAITVGANRVAIGRCGAAAARVRRTRRFTRVTARWLACDGVAGKVRLRGRIDAGTCRQMTGVLRAPRAGIRRAFTALRTRSGLEGRLVPPPGARSDRDTADLGAGPDNDRTAAAQPIAVPGTVGGAGYHRDDADHDDDFFALELDGRPLIVTLRIADPARLDLDLLLLDDRLRDVVPPARGDGATAALATTDESGPAWLVVFAVRGLPGGSPPGAPRAVPWSAYTLELRRGGEPAGAGEEDDVGPVHVRLLDADSGALLQQTRADAAGGWRLDFPEPIAPGRYHIVAGTDRDGDGDLAEPGEAVARTAEPLVVGASAVVLVELLLVEWGG